MKNDNNEIITEKETDMATFFNYKCEHCGYTVAANPKGKDVIMTGETIVAPVPKKCPECGGKMVKTDTVLMMD